MHWTKFKRIPVYLFIRFTFHKVSRDGNGILNRYKGVSSLQHSKHLSKFLHSVPNRVYYRYIHNIYIYKESTLYSDRFSVQFSVQLNELNSTLFVAVIFGVCVCAQSLYLSVCVCVCEGKRAFGWGLASVASMSIGCMWLAGSVGRSVGRLALAFFSVVIFLDARKKHTHTHTHGGNCNCVCVCGCLRCLEVTD